jgi:hypothetical protein
MGRIWDGKPFISVAQLGRHTGLSRFSLVKALRSNGVPIRNHGTKHVVWRADIETTFPTFVDSIRFRSGDDD